MERKVRNWIRQKSIELLQETNEIFVELVLGLLERERGDEVFFEKLERILDEDTQGFIKALWRYLIFEELKLVHKYI